MSPESPNAALAAKATPTQPRARLAVSLLFFLNGAFFATWVSRLPTIQAANQLSHAELGLALLGMALGALVAMPITGGFAAKVASQHLAWIFTLVFGLSLAALAYSPNAACLCVALFIFGAMHGALDIVMNAQAVAVEQLYQRPLMSSFHALFSGGGLAGAAAGAGFAALGIAPHIHFTLVALLLVASVRIISYPHLLPRTQTQAADHKQPPAQPKARSPKFRLPSGNLLLMGGIAFFSMLTEGAVADWSAIFMREITHSSETLAAASFAAYSSAMMAGRILGDAATLRFGSVAIVRGGGILSAIGLLLALLTSHPLAAFVGFAFVGLGLSTIVPQVFSAAGRAEGQSPEAGLATVTTVGYTGFLIGPPIIGFLAQMTDLRIGLGITLAASLFLIAAAPSLRPRRRQSGPAPAEAPPLGSLTASLR